MEDASSSPLEASPYSMECAQAEILAGSISCDVLASPTHVQTMRHIHHLLEEDDPPSGCTDDFFSFGELMAYHAKASEFAAILKQDSPALSFNLTLKKLLGTPSISEERPGILPYPETKCPGLHAHDHAADWSHKKLHWMNNLGPPRSLALSTSCMPSKFLDGPFYRNVSHWRLRTLRQEGEEEEEGPSGTIHVHFGRRREKDHRMMYALKPRKENRLKVSGKSEVSHENVDLCALLVRCAQEIGSNNTKAAMKILVKVKQHASPYGSGEQRLAQYFAEALEARLAGTGWQIYLGDMGRHGPTPKQIRKAGSMYMSSCPFAKAFRYFANRAILDVAKEASTLHIIEHQVTGFQYPSLFRALAARPGGPPQVRLIGANAPHYSMASSQIEEILDELKQTGRHIAAWAAACGVPFHFTAYADILGRFPLQKYVSPNRSPDEVFVVLSAYPLRYINDDLLNPPMKRSEIFKSIRASNPDAYIQGIVTGSYNTPFFSRRFQEALFHFGSQYDMLDTFIDRQNKDRIVFESEILGKAVLNIVACEETNVVERVDKYKQWHAVSKGVGLEPIPVNQEMKEEVQKILKSWHKDYMVTEDLNYILMGWRGRTLHAIGAWKGLNASIA